MPYWLLSGYQRAEGYHTVTPYLVVPGVTQLRFLTRQTHGGCQLLIGVGNRLAPTSLPPTTRKPPSDWQNS
jgi:hypothetical protein